VSDFVSPQSPSWLLRNLTKTDIFNFNFNFNIHPTPKEKNSSRQLQYNNIDVEWGDYSGDRNLCKSIVVPGHILLTILNSVGLLQKQNINIKAIFGLIHRRSLESLTFTNK